MSKKITAKNAAKQDFMPLMRELVRAYQAFANFDARLHRDSGYGLTVSQADVIFTLGNTEGMSCGEVGERTLITKGTLTGVIDRLVKKGLVKRSRMEHDGRSVRVSLTSRGEKVFNDAFPRHVSILSSRFEKLDPEIRRNARSALAALRAIF